MIRTYVKDTDNRRKEIMWLALGLLGALGLAFFLALYVGYAFPMRSRDEAVILVGLVVFLACAIAYFAGKEREQRHLNQSLVHSLRQAVNTLQERSSRFDDLACRNRELEAALQRLQAELVEAYLRALRTLLATLDTRDTYTARHGEQVTAIAVKIAQRMGLDPSLVETIAMFGPVHDLGKISIPDHILRKAGPLSDEEVALCRQHPLTAETIIRPLQPSAEALAMLRHHHERWDGAGYPDGLRGEQIPLLARILGVADAYHALISQRPYRAARAASDAVREMMAHAGRQFDPDIVGVLAQLAAEGALEGQGAS